MSDHQDVHTIGIALDEGYRTLQCPHGHAKARYRVALLTDGKYAFSMQAEYKCGNHSGKAIPWNIHDTREQCIHNFVRIAREHFGHEHTCSVSTPGQRAAGLWMLDQLGNGLFGFLEPEPSPNND